MVDSVHIRQQDFSIEQGTLTPQQGDKFQYKATVNFNGNKYSMVITSSIKKGQNVSEMETTMMKMVEGELKVLIKELAKIASETQSSATLQSDGRIVKSGQDYGKLLDNVKDGVDKAEITKLLESIQKAGSIFYAILPQTKSKDDEHDDSIDSNSTQGPFDIKLLNMEDDDEYASEAEL